MALAMLSISLNPAILIVVYTIVGQPGGNPVTLNTFTYFELPLQLLSQTCVGIEYRTMPKLWRRLGRQRNRSQGSKPQVVTQQTMKSQSINPQSTKLQAITLQRIAQRSFPQHRTKSESTTPESSKPPSIISQSEEDGEMEGYESVPERYWACCDCAEGGMSTFIECCSECKHYRCEDCPVELLKHRISDKSLSDAFAPLDEYDWNTKIKKKPPTFTTSKNGFKPNTLVSLPL